MVPGLDIVVSLGIVGAVIVDRYGIPVKCEMAREYYYRRLVGSAEEKRSREESK